MNVNKPLNSRVIDFYKTVIKTNTHIYYSGKTFNKNASLVQGDENA